MPNSKQIEILHQGVETWNRWRKENAETKIDLSEANLRGLDLGGGDPYGPDGGYESLDIIELNKANLSKADLREMDLSRANLERSNLSDANLSRADLCWANLSEADLSGSDFSNAKLFDTNLRKVKISFGQVLKSALNEHGLPTANFHKADLRSSDLFQAELMRTNFCQANLQSANLERSNLSNSYLKQADLSNADLSNANLSEANLSGADLSRAKLCNSNLTKADLSNADLTKSNLNGAFLVETNLEGANLSYGSVYGSSVWNLKTNQLTKQQNLKITPNDEPVITVDNIEIAQFIYLLLNHQNLRQVINSVTERGVLILGRFGGGGIEVLYAVADKLRGMNYLPIVFDFDRPKHRNLTETVKTLAGLSRFVIADLSGPSVPQELYATVPHFKIPFVPILEARNRPYAMFSDILEYDWVVKPIVEFDSIECLIKQLPSKIVKPAEKQHKKRQKLLRELFG